MNQNEQNFDALKKLLKLKQHEVPPPGYYNNFSGQVISRIRAGEANYAQSMTERLQAEAPWLVSLFRVFEARPGLIGAFATSLCLLLVGVVVFSERSEQASKNLIAISEPTAPTGNAAVASLSAAPIVAATDNSNSGIVASTNPVTSLQPTATLFGQSGGSTLFQPAGFMQSAH